MKTLITSLPDIAFWIIWAIECIFMLWWTGSELKLKYLSMPPFVYFGWLWLGITLLLFLIKWRIFALTLAVIAGIPLAIMGVFLLIVFIASLFGPIRWN